MLSVFTSIHLKLLATVMLLNFKRCVGKVAGISWFYFFSISPNEDLYFNENLTNVDENDDKCQRK